MIIKGQEGPLDSGSMILKLLLGVNNKPFYMGLCDYLVLDGPLDNETTSV